jgi:hypothetical protein
MSSQSNHRRNAFWGLTTLVFTLACSIVLGPATGEAPAPVYDPTKAALEFQATQMILQMTQAAMNIQAPPPTQAPPLIQQIAPTQEQILPTAPQDVAERIRKAKILVYEDAQGAGLATWVRQTLNMMGLNYTWDGDALGYFMEHLNSGTQWDLIIVAAENRSGVQGEFWDVIMPKVNNDKTALIVEMWYLSDIANGRISALTSKCGIRFQKVRSEVDSIYTLNSSHPVFTTPNNSFGLTHYVGYWMDKGGDYVRVSGGDAEILAGGYVNNKSDYGLITACIEGRVIVQTFSDHDYHQEDIMALWENYITYVLTNRFAVVP